MHNAFVGKEEEEYIDFSLTDSTDCHRCFLCVFAPLREIVFHAKPQRRYFSFFASLRLCEPFIFFLSQIPQMRTDVFLCAFARDCFLKKN